MRLSDVHPRTRVDLTLERVRRRDARRGRRGHRRLPARRRRADGRRRCASSGVRVVDLSADFRLRDRDDLRRSGTATHKAPDLFGQRRLRAARALPRPAARRRPGRQPRLLPDRRAARPRAARARRADRRRRHRREVRRLRRRPRAPTTTTHFVSADENLNPYKVDGPPPHAGDRAGARRARRGPEDHLRPAPRAARRRASWTPATSGRRARPTTPSCSSSIARPTRDEPWVEVVLGAAGRPRGPRHQRLPHVRPLRRAHGPDHGLQRASTTCGRAPRRRRSRTST